MTESPTSSASSEDDEPTTARDAMRSARLCIAYACMFTAASMANALPLMMSGHYDRHTLWVRSVNFGLAIGFAMLTVYVLWKAVIYGMRSVVLEGQGVAR